MSKLFGRLSLRVGLSVVAALLVALLVQVILGKLVVEHHVHTARDRSLSAVLQLARAACAAGALDDGQLAARFGGYDELVLALYDQSGALLSQSRPDGDAPRRLPPEVRERALRAHDFVYMAPPSGADVMAALARVERAGQGQFVALFDAMTARRLRAARVTMLVLAFLSFGVVGLGAGLWVAITVRRRLRAMQQVVSTMARGELGRRLDEPGDDELGELAVELNGMADALAHTIEQLREEQRWKQRMFADLTHELRTPLTNVRGYVESLGMAELAQEGDKRARYLTVLEQQVAALTRLVEDLSTLSQLECEGLSLTVCPTELTRLVEQELSAMQPKAHEAGVQLLLQSSGPAPLYADELRLGQVVRNLLDNAIRYSPEGGMVELRIEQRPERVTLRVLDHGAGIAPEQLEHVTRRFYRTDPSRARATGGRGLGLSIAAAIAEAHGGALEVRSQLGRGTEVTLSLPSGEALPAHEVA